MKPAVSSLLALAALLFGVLPGVASAQDFPKLTGRVTDAASIIPDDVEARLTQKLEALEQQSQRQLVVATIPDLQGYEISDYGYRLGREWGIGDKERNDGALLIVAPNERKVRIEVGYGLEPVLTDGFSWKIINNDIVPRFKQGDMPGGIEAGTDAIITQLTLPPEEAARIAQQANEPEQVSPGDFAGMIFFMLIFGLVFIMPILRAILGLHRRRYGPGGAASVILWNVVDTLGRASSSSGSSSSGGGFSGGGGSFGGGGSSGSW